MVMVKDVHLVGFRIGAETFGVPIALVHEIVRVPEITTVPEAPECVDGVINLRGKIIPIVDLRKRFGERSCAPNKRNRILVAEFEGKLVGLMVDAASEVLKIPPSEIEAPPDVFEDGQIRYVTGVGKLGGRLIIMVDITKVLQRGELRRISDVQVQAQASSAAGSGI
jgi:purine-binding chemotaxis protein CheW